MYGSTTYGGTSYGGMGRVSAGTDYTKTLSETLVLTSSIIRSIGKTLSSNIITNSTVIKAITRGLSDLYSVTSTLINKGIKVLSSSIILNESLIVRALVKTLTSTITITSTLIRSIARGLSDIYTVVDIFIKQQVKTFLEAINLSEVINILLVFNRVFTEELILVVTFIKSFTRSFNDSYTVISTYFNKGIKNLLDTFHITDFFAIAGQYYRTLTDSIISLSTVVQNVFYARTLSDVLSAIDNGITKMWLKSFSNIVGIVDTIKKYLNGFFVEGWNKIVKIISSFSKQSKNDSDWNKTEKFRPSKLKLQDGSYLLFQDNSKINIVIRRGSIFSNIAKTVSSWGSNSKNNTTWNK